MYRRIPSAAVYVLALCGLAHAQPAWFAPEHPWRAVMKLERADAQCVLAELPLEGGVAAAPLKAAALDAAGRPLEYRVVHEGAGRAAVLVRLEGATNETVAVYYGGDTPGPRARPDLKDPAPIELTVLFQGSPNVPTTTSGLLFLGAVADAPVKRLRAVSNPMTDLFDREGSEAEKKNASRSWIVRAVSNLLCPEDGEYRFALDCRDAGVLLVDGEPAVEWPGEHGGGDWRVGPPFRLSAGVHRLEMLNMSRNWFAMRLGWQRPGRAAIVSIETAQLIAGGEPQEARLERMDTPLHPFFTYKVERAYSFYGRPLTFVPVQFRDESRNWLADNVRFAWEFGAAAAAGGPAESEARHPRHVFSAPAVHSVRLRVRDALGFEAERERRVDCRRVPVDQYAFACEVLDLPSACYPRDRVAPRLRLTGTPAGGIGLDAMWQVRAPSGRVSAEGRAAVFPGLEAQFLSLPEMAAGDVAEITWSLAHAGAVLERGAIRFLSPPFESLPVAARGDHLLDREGRIIVLVPFAEAGVFAQPAITTAEAFGSLVCLDDFLAVPGADEDGRGGRIVDGPDRPFVTRVTLPAPEAVPGVYAPLRKFTRAVEAVEDDTDVVILSVGLSDMPYRTGADMFERQAAALTDLVSATMGRPVLWVTPPPYRPDPDRIRPLAAAIRRAAEARRVPVADLFTAFQGLEGRRGKLLSGEETALTRAGQDLTAQLIARALLQE